MGQNAQKIRYNFSSLNLSRIYYLNSFFRIKAHSFGKRIWDRDFSYPQVNYFAEFLDQN